jgi:GNAT superfamily N-acetyltransferase
VATVRVRSLAFRTDLMVLRLAGSELEDGGDHLVVRTPLNPLFYWGNFILLSGMAAVEDASRWLQTFARAFPDAQHVAIGWDRGSELGARRLEPLLRAGLELTVDRALLAEGLSSPRRPPAATEVRRLAGEGDWLQLRELTATSCSGEGSPEFQAARQADFRRIEATGRAAFYGAFRRGELVSACGIVSGRGGTARFQHVQTHPEHRRQGVASAVLIAASHHAETHFRARRLVIVADPGGPAIRLYRELGFRPAGSQLQLTAAPLAKVATPG